MTPKLEIRARGRIRNRWMLRLGVWLISRCTVETFVNGKSLGRQRLVDAAVIEEDE